jgi:hypothetical protein
MLWRIASNNSEIDPLLRVLLVAVLTPAIGLLVWQVGSLNKPHPPHGLASQGFQHCNFI